MGKLEKQEHCGGCDSMCPMQNQRTITEVLNELGVDLRDPNIAITSIVTSDAFIQMLKIRGVKDCHPCSEAVIKRKQKGGRD